MRASRAMVWLLPLICAACADSRRPGQQLQGEGGASAQADGDRDRDQGGALGNASGDPGGDGDGDDPDRCEARATTVEVATQTIDKLDLLFMVDNSGSMREEQESLREQFPRLIAALTSGDREDDGVQDFPPARDLHLGVLSSDMGLVGIDEIQNCQGLGDDGVLLNAPSPEVIGCQPSYPRFLTYLADVNDPGQTAVDFACIAALGTDGCGFEQQLEAALKALWPSVDIDPDTGQPRHPNRILFLGDVNGFGQLGHGDTDNAGFLRNDPSAGLSAIAVVVVSDEEDCSSANTSHFAPSHNLDPDDPRATQDLNLRCFFNPENLYPVDRYINGLKALRPGNEQLVLFSAIVGVPQDLVEPARYNDVDWQDDAARNAFYDDILNDMRMQQVVDPNRPTELGGNLLPSCDTTRGRAYPPRRIVEVARGFGANGVVQSICQDDFSPAIDAIVERAGQQLGAPCLPRPLARRSNGLTACEVIWELPPVGSASASTPVRCDAPGYDFLDEPSSGRDSSARGGARCAVRQLAVEHGEPRPTAGGASGWYYDDFSESVASECLGATKQRVAFTPEAKPPTGVTVLLTCPTERGEVCDG